MINNVKLHYVLLILIVFLGFFIRIYKLSETPTGFFADEASIGYNAYTILTKGTNEYGVSYPIFFQSFEDYRPPLAIYSTIPFIGLLGLNELSTRLPSVLYGLITIIAMYLIGKEISSKKSRSFGLLTAFITATMPWLIHYNRTGFEFTIYVTFFSTKCLAHYSKLYCPVVSFLFHFRRAHFYYTTFCRGFNAFIDNNTPIHTNWIDTYFSHNEKQ
ncbi:MAG: glycosyltransferase family 39 protein [Patescibacteria group bacterium]